MKQTERVRVTMTCSLRPTLLRENGVRVEASLPVVDRYRSMTPAELTARVAELGIASR